MGGRLGGVEGSSLGVFLYKAFSWGIVTEYCWGG